MHSNRSSTLGSTRALSLSTEYMNSEPSLIAIPPPMSNLPYDPPHLSRWQHAPQRLPTTTTNSRSGSAVASRIDSTKQSASNASFIAAKSATLNDQFRALTLSHRNHCDPHSRGSAIRPGIINATTYELSDDLRAREVDLMERYYGGRLRAQRAARIIQRRFREYRMRAQYAQLRTERRLATNRFSNNHNHHHHFMEDQREAPHLASMEDLVIDRAYLDWESEVVGSPTGVGSIPDITAAAAVETTKGNRSSAPSASTQSPESGGGEDISSHSCTNLTAPKGHGHHHHHHQSSSPGTGTGSTSGFVSSPGSCSSGSLPAESTPVQQQTQPVSAYPVIRQTSDQPGQQQQMVYYVVDREETIQKPQPPRLQQPTQSPQQQRQLYVAVPVLSDGHHYPNGVVPQPMYLTQAPTSAVLVRRSSTGSNTVQAPVWCTPDGKMYALAYAEQQPGVAQTSKQQQQQQQQQQQHPVVVAPVRGSNHSPLVLQFHQSPSQRSGTNLVPRGSLGPVSATTTVANAVVAERRRKRLYRVCLNYFNKSPVKGMDMLIRFRFLEATPRQIARFLHTRRGLARTAIGEYLGEMKHELCVATARHFVRQVDFRDKEIDEALRIMMSLFRTPGESQKIVHLMTAFQAAYVEQNAARVAAAFRNADSVMVLAYAIIMLHTDMYSPNVRPDAKMSREDFVNNLRGIDDGQDLDRSMLVGIYDRMRGGGEMVVAGDHTEQVRRVHRLLTGPLRPTNLVLPHRRLVCYCRLYEVPDKTKRDRSGAHQRDIFLFNDLLLVTKSIKKRRKESASANQSSLSLAGGIGGASTTYQVRACVTLLGIRVTTFETPHYENGFSLYRVDQSVASGGAEEENGKKGKSSTSNSAAKRSVSQKGSLDHPVTPRGTPVISFNAKTPSDKMRLLDDLQECIMETAEMDRIRLDDVLGKQQSAVVSQKAATTTATVFPSYVVPMRSGMPVCYQPQMSVDAGFALPQQTQRAYAYCAAAAATAHEATR